MVSKQKQKEILNKAEKILSKYIICDECLGRQFGQLLSGYTNKQRGEYIRTLIAMELDANNITFNQTLLKNLSNFNFRNLSRKTKEEMKELKTNPETSCQICSGLFSKTKEISENILNTLKNYEFKTFEIGITLSHSLLNKEEELWELAGIEYCESIKTNLSRVIGKEISNKLDKDVSHKNPDMYIYLDLSNNQINIKPLSLFIYGKYNKYQEMPQTKWICLKCKGKGCSYCDYKGKLYENSVEEEISKHFKGTEHKTTKFHGAGREDIDVMCLGWREFVLELVEPKKRTINLKEIQKQINKSKTIEVKDLEFTNKKKVREIKAKTSRKIYEMEIPLTPEKYKIVKENINNLETLKNKTINQQTPKRVAHRRADKIRKRKIYDINVKELNKNKLILEIESESGTYIKELVSGDEGRTRPSITSLLKTPLSIKTLKVIGFKD